MNEHPIATAPAAGHMPREAPEATPIDTTKHVDAPDSPEAHEYRSEWNQDEDENQHAGQDRDQPAHPR